MSDKLVVAEGSEPLKSHSQLYVRVCYCIVDSITETGNNPAGGQIASARLEHVGLRIREPHGLLIVWKLV